MYVNCGGSYWKNNEHHSSLKNCIQRSLGVSKRFREALRGIQKVQNLKYGLKKMQLKHFLSFFKLKKINIGIGAVLAGRLGPIISFIFRWPKGQLCIEIYYKKLSQVHYDSTT